MYINEIIRINYRCNWKCKFCNVSKVNNFGHTDITYKQIVSQILLLVKKYSPEARKELILSFSGGEPTLNKSLVSYIKMAKSIGIGKVQIQTNGSIIFRNRSLFHDLLDAGLDEIFLAQHSHKDDINKDLGCLYKFDDFLNWFEYIKENNIRCEITLNIVISKINIHFLGDFIKLLHQIGFIDYIGKQISFGFCQPNGYAWQNKEELLLTFDKDQQNTVTQIVEYCKKNNIFLDFHYTSPPICILPYFQYNLEYNKLRKLEKDEQNGTVDQSNLNSLKFLKKEKRKLEGCGKCRYDKYCFGFYKNWIQYMGEDTLTRNISKFIKQ